MPGLRLARRIAGTTLTIASVPVFLVAIALAQLIAWVDGPHNRRFTSALVTAPPPAE